MNSSSNETDAAEPVEPTATGDSTNPNQKSSWLVVFLKIFVCVLVLMLLGVVVLYAMGSGEYRITATQKIKATRGEVFKLITEPESVEKWVTGVASIEPDPESEIEGHGVGAKSIITVDAGGSNLIINDEVTKSQFNREMELKMTSDAFTVVNNFQLKLVEGFTPEDEVIEVVQDYRIRFKGVARVFAPFIKGMVEDQIKSDLKRLRDLAEKKDAAEEKPDEEK